MISNEKKNSKSITQQITTVIEGKEKTEGRELTSEEIKEVVNYIGILV